MVWNQDLWKKLIDNDRSVSILRAAYEKWAVNSGIPYDDLVKYGGNLPQKNIFLEMGADEVYELIEKATNWKKSIMNLVQSILGDEIRVIHNNGNGSSRSIRKLWYKFKALLQDIFQQAYAAGNYKFDLDKDPQFYEDFPKKISIAAQYWTTNQIDKDTEWVGEMATTKRDAVCTYADLGVVDISRKRSQQKKIIRMLQMNKFYEEYEDLTEFKEDVENKYDLMANSYVDHEELLEIIQAEITREDDYNSPQLHIIAMVEKDTEFDLLDKMGEYIGVSVISGHGQNSLASIEKLINDKNIKRGSKIIFLSICDDDPKGFQIGRSPAEQQFIKMGMDVILWVHSMWHQKLTPNQRATQAYLPKLGKKTKGTYTPFIEKWVQKVGYDKKADVFGGGEFGFELDCLEDSQIRESFAELCWAIGLTAENILESYKMDNREDREDCVSTSASTYVDDNTNYGSFRSALNTLKNAITAPIDDILSEISDVRDNMVEDVEKKLDPISVEIIDEEDFDDRDVTQYVDSYNKDFLSGSRSWGKKWGADVCKSSVLDDKLTEALDNKHDDLSIKASDYDTVEIDKDEILEKIQEIIEDHDLNVTRFE